VAYICPEVAYVLAVYLVIRQPGSWELGNSGLRPGTEWKFRFFYMAPKQPSILWATVNFWTGI